MTRGPLFRLLAVGLVVLAAGCSVTAKVFPKRFTVPNDAMDPALRQGKSVVGKPVHHYHPHRGDIVIFVLPVREGGDGRSLMIKRVVAVGGDTVDCCGPDGQLLLNGKALTEPYVAHKELDPGTEPWEGAGRGAVPAGSIWVAGDNRTASNDSRHFGPVPISSVRYLVKR